MGFRCLLSCVLLSGSLLSMGQLITHRPVLGGLSPNAGRMYVRANTMQPFTVELFTDSLFTSVLSYSGSVKAAADSSTIVELKNLQPNTLYFYRLRFGTTMDVRQGSFRTFPTEGKRGYYVFATGSCHETDNMKVFEAIETHQPRLFLHTGDYTYPSYQLDNTYPANYPAVELAWRRRYEEPLMKEMLRTVPIDYVHDDDDSAGPFPRPLVQHDLLPRYGWSRYTTNW